MRTGHVAAVRPRKELVTFQLIELHSVPRQLGPDCRLPKLAGSTALIAPEPRHAHRRAQFPGLCLLRPRNRERTLEMRLRIRRTRPLRQQRDFAGYGWISASCHL